MFITAKLLTIVDMVIDIGKVRFVDSLKASVVKGFCFFFPKKKEERAFAF